MSDPLDPKATPDITPLTPNASKTPVAGVQSAKFAPGRTWRRTLRIEQAARLCSSGQFSNEEIANHLGINKQTLVLLKQTKEFQSKILELATGVISSYDKDLREDIENSRAELRAMVPMALLGLRSALLSKNEQIKMRAITEVMDREGTLSRVSRTSVSLESKPDMSQASITGQSLLSLLQSAAPTEAQKIEVTTNGAFTMNASDASIQATKMRDTIDQKTLDEIDASELPVN